MDTTPQRIGPSLRQRQVAAFEKTGMEKKLRMDKKIHWDKPAMANGGYAHREKRKRGKQRFSCCTDLQKPNNYIQKAPP